MKRNLMLALCIIISTLIVSVAVYVVYLSSQYYRIEDEKPITVENNKEDTLSVNKKYSALTYNIGFGAYTHEFSFFMDSGVMKDGTKVKGNGSVAKDEQTVLDNTNGVIEETDRLDADFLLFQEVDTDSTRSYHIDQSQMIKEAYPEYSSAFAQNFHSGYLFYPVFSPHGSVNSGLLTLSAHGIGQAVRRSFPVDESFPNKFFDLDRCFALNRINVENGKELVLINCHMSAYDEGGKVRAKQLEMLCNVLSEEYEKGNYVVVGGDYNHAICNTQTVFDCEQQIPEWIAVFDENDLPEGFSIVSPKNVTEVATCRSTDIPYEEGVNYTVTIDGFIVSDNVTAVAENIDSDFKYSDHNPVYLEFELQ